MSPPSDLVLVAFGVDDTLVRALPVTGKVSIGRSTENDVCLNDSSVSRKHCVVHVGHQLRLEDLGGANGTFLRGTEPIPANETRALRQISRQAVDIAIGDRITVGATLLVVRRADRVRPRAPVGDADDTTRDQRMRALYQQAERAAQALINVLILGETGVGKEVLSRAIHDRSPRAKHPFVSLNCAALSESLLESELFGHEKGAFTGAHAPRRGLLESAHGGTVLLDEIGELPLSVQVKLLRVLEDRRVVRVGSNEAQSIDVRFIAATNRNLEEAVARGTFREDLYFRLNGFTLEIPPLRERRGEIEPLARMFAAAASQQLDRSSPPAFAPRTLELLDGHRWPGNVRELRNVIERAVLLCDGATLLPDHLPSKLVDPPDARPPPSSGEPAPPASSPGAGTARDNLLGQIDALERDRILAALEQCAGNQTRAADVLGISRRTLATWLDRHKIPRPRKRD